MQNDRGTVDGSDRGAFGTGPYSWLPAMLPLGWSGSHRVWRDALLTAIILWVPLAILSALQGLAITPYPRQSFLLDAGACGRYLVAAPLFVLSGSVYLPRLALAVRQFVDAGLIADRDRARYEALIASTRKLLASRLSEAALLVLAYAVMLVLSPVLYSPGVPTWVTPGAPESHDLSLAGWWRALVSQPLFLVLQGTWLLRLFAWCRFLWHVSRMDLQLVAGHPDRLGGLQFVAITIRSSLVLAFAWGVILAGTIADGVIFDGHAITDYSHLILAHVVTMLLIFCGPMLTLWVPVLRLQWHGTLKYGRLASQLGHEFEERWTAGHRRVNEKALEVPDFSATTDLYSIVSNVRDMRLFFLDTRSVAALIIAALLPLLPLVFVRLPLDEILRMALKAIV